jgi:hypothetical protein
VKYLSIDAVFPWEINPTTSACIPTKRAISPQNLGIISRNKIGTEIIEINFGNIRLNK